MCARPPTRIIMAYLKLHSRPMHPWVYVVFFLALLGSNALVTFWLYTQCPAQCWFFLLRLSGLETLILYLSIFLYRIWVDDHVQAKDAATCMLKDQAPGHV